MSKSTKIWLTVATILVAIGTGIFVGAMSSCNWDFTKLSTHNYVTNSYEIKENFDKISISVDTTDIEFLPTEDKFCTITVFENESEKHSVVLENGSLIIKINDTRKWYEHIGINVFTPEMTIYLPKSEYSSLFVETDTGDVTIPKAFTFENLNIDGETSDVDSKASVSGELKIKVSTGNIHLDSLSIGELRLTASTGDVKVNNAKVQKNVTVKTSTGNIKFSSVTCNSFLSGCDTGNVTLKNIQAGDILRVKTSTGNVTFVDSDAAHISVNTSTGDVTGTLLSEKVFITETSTGDVFVPKTITGGLCEVKTSTGDIIIDITK